MTDEYLKTLMKTLEQRRMRTALESVPATKTDPGYTNKPVLIRTVIAGRHQLIHPSNFIEALEKQGQEVDAQSLEITDLHPTAPPETVDKPAEETPPADEQLPVSTEDVPADGTGADIPPVVPTKQVWSEAELEEIGKKKGGYNKLRSISKLYDDVSGNASKAELIKAISGKPKP